MERLTEIHSGSRLYEAYRTELIRFATALAGPDDAPDVLSDAVESLLRSGQLVEAEYPLALLYRAVLAKANSMHRSVFRRRAREQRFAQSVVIEDPELRPDVVAAVVRLSPQKRACVYLTYWEDLAPDAVAERLGIGEGTVKKYLARARAQLREVLDE
ncbi:MAG: RNA polymerase sigma factor [Acidimicrobiia bacterium]|nr:RNA polymerase sigma factor [Acidimicrobiia bacterium]